MSLGKVNMPKAYVWILDFGGEYGDNTQIQGVFGSKDRAVAHVEQLIKDDGTWKHEKGYNGYESWTCNGDSYTISRYVVE